ncbi:MAG TPA: hypothetical protein VNC50_16195 [Planctomycetia bacterium]|nr:hypothetical protein [Planctomycetia bacterium]
MSRNQPPPDPKRESRDVWDAFFFVIGLSLCPFFFALIGMGLIEFNVIPVFDYDPDGKGVKALGKGMKILVAFACLGFLPPLFFGIHLMLRNRREARADAAARDEDRS